MWGPPFPTSSRVPIPGAEPPPPRTVQRCGRTISPIPTLSEYAEQTALFPHTMDTKRLGIYRTVLNFSFLPLQALERAIVCKLHLKNAPLLQLRSHSRRAEEHLPPPPLAPPAPPRPAPSPASTAGMGEGKRKATLPLVPLGGAHFPAEKSHSGGGEGPNPVAVV
jgi:hypothetical protein